MSQIPAMASQKTKKKHCPKALCHSSRPLHNAPQRLSPFLSGCKFFQKEKKDKSLATSAVDSLPLPLQLSRNEVSCCVKGRCRLSLPFSFQRVCWYTAKAKTTKCEIASLDSGFGPSTSHVQNVSQLPHFF